MAAAVALIDEDRSSVGGWLLLVVSGIVLAMTAHRWIKALPGVLALGVVGGITTALSGHALNQPDSPISLPHSIFLIGFAATSAVVSSTFVQRRTSWMDRLLLSGFVAGILTGAVIERWMIACWLGALAALCVAWIWDRVRRQSRPSGRHQAERSQRN